MNLVDVIKQQLAGEVGKKLSGMAGISEGDLQKTIGVALPGLLSGLGSVASTKQGAEKVANAIGGLDSSMFGNLASMVGGGALQKGGSMLGNLLGGGVVDGLAAAIAKTTGISQALIKTALGYLVPLVLGSIGSSFKGGKIDANGISKLFSEQKQNIAASVPAGLNLDSISGFKALSNAGSAAVSAASCAAKGVDFLLPRKPMPPEDAQEIAFPWVSVMVTMVLLNDDLICTTPRSMSFFSRRLRDTFFSAGLAMLSLRAHKGVNSCPYLAAATFFLPVTWRLGPLRVRAFCLVF